jgi:hypothetical protein
VSAGRPPRSSRSVVVLLVGMFFVMQAVDLILLAETLPS